MQLFAIFIFGVDFSETYLMTSAESSVSEPPNLKNFLGRIPPDPPYKAPKAPAFGTRNNAPLPPPPLVTKDLATALPVREKLGVDCVL